MRKSLLLALALSANTGTYAALAQSTLPGTSATAPKNYLAIISFNETVLKTNEAQKDFANLQKKFGPREAHLKALNDEVENSKNQLNTSGEKLSDTERAMRMQTLDTKNKQLQREAEDYRNDTQTESQQVFQEVAQKVFSFLQDYARRHGYSFVIERGSADNPIIWYAANSADITSEVAQAYNAQTAVAAPNPEPRTSKLPSSKQPVPAHRSTVPPHN